MASFSRCILVVVVVVTLKIPLNFFLSIIVCMLGCWGAKERGFLLEDWLLGEKFLLNIPTWCFANLCYLVTRQVYLSQWKLEHSSKIRLTLNFRLFPSLRSVRCEEHVEKRRWLWSEGTLPFPRLPPRVRLVPPFRLFPQKESLDQFSQFYTNQSSLHLKRYTCLPGKRR